MRIKRLELHGFKSFKDKTVINFDSGITGIVGPNGCGKSNVVDAFFWALGEMNARNLRGQNMEDLIFAGSDHAPAANAAEVNLILDIPAELSGANAPSGASLSDFALVPLMREVAVTRRLYRNGESEYLINKVPCRLKDIQELFMDTGAGARGYSIIQQGKIAEIVNAKPDERRTMIEDVAGVVKYKSRRREAQRKLEGTTQNLLRVTDILTEIETRKKQMERQAEKARRYKEWKEELQTIELRHSASQWEEIVEKIGGWDSELEALEFADASITIERETADTYVQQKRLESASAAKVSEEFQAKWIEQARNLNSAETSNTYQSKVLEDLKVALQNIEVESETEKVRIEELLAVFSNAEEEAITIESSHKEAQTDRVNAEQDSRQSKQYLDEQEIASERSHQAYLQNTAEAARAEQKVLTAENRLHDLETKLNELESQKASESERTESIRSEYTIASEVMIEADEARKATEIEHEEVSRSIVDMRREIEVARRGLAETERAEVRLASSLRALEDQKKRYEGSALGVQTIFQTLLPKNEAWKSGVQGTLASVLKVAPGMEIAVETVLGPMLEIVLTKSGESAAELARALRESSGGRAAFADLSQIPSLRKDKESIPAAESLLAHVDLSGELAKNSEAKSLIDLLLGNAYLARDLAEARDLAALYGNAIFVTREGEVCRDKWFLSGGNTSPSLVARNREIEELRLEQATEATKIETAKALLSELEEKFLAAQARQNELETEREFKRKEFSEKSSQAAVFAAQMKQAAHALEAVEKDLQRFNGEMQTLRAQEEEARTLVASLAAEGERLNREWQERRANIPELRTQYEAAQQKMTEAKVLEASLLEQKNSVQSTRLNAKSNLDRAEARVENLLRQAMEKQELAETAREEIERLQEIVSELRVSIVSSEAEFRAARDSLDQINGELEEYRKKSESTVKRERETKDKISHVKMSMERVLFERQNISQNVMDRYGIDIAEFVANPETKDQLMILRAKGEAAHKELEADVLRLKEKIRKLGEVNTAAIEEYDELVTRFTFLSEQKADLEKSMADLQSTIDKINRISRDRFFRAFDEVNKQFTQVFPALFGGGQAQLTLTSPDDFNETGVDIVAQPPGKKLQNINLLSGGEKTLTAISLLFAIFLVKPSPFCLLDEVDAPLDDANIGRFNALLREMSKQSQFIIITHNKRTMELNDKLYGVTMEDAGISKMVSIQLTG